MILTVIIAGILAGLTVLSGLLILFFMAYRRGVKVFTDFVKTPGENQPSQFAVLVDTVAQVFAQRITNTVKTTLMGMSSVDSRNERAMTGELAAGAVALKYPALAAIMSAIPSLRKRLIKNPELTGIAQMILSGMGKNGEKQPGDNQPPVQLTL